MAEAGPPPARFPPARLPPAGSSRAGLPPTGSPPASTPALASQWLAVKRLPRAAAKAPNLQLNQDHCSFVPFTQAVPVQVDMAMALHRVRIAEKYGKNYLCLLQAVFLAETGLLLQLKDINHFLMQDIAFLSGGRGKDNAWIITFPENCNFRCIPEEVIAKVLNYLTSIARQSGSDSRFTIILDRRLDTWASLKISLQKISASFPGSLHLVLVLRPTSFLQRTFTDIGFRFSQEDFMLKLPAIEKFAVTVKEMAQMLQSFGTELAETELPQDILSIEEILAGRAERYHLLKNDLTAVTKEGKVLLMNLQVPATEETVSSSLECTQHINGDWQTIKKLLAQVHDMETAFDGFWEKHQLKMEQYLQLWKFEQDFQEAVTQVEFLLSQQRELGDITGNLAQVKQRLKKLEILDDKSQELLTKARIVILRGHKLASNHHYALDLICQRCNELRYLSDILVNEIRTKRVQLSRTFKVHRLLQQARQCCDQGECLLASQGMDKFQTKEDAQKALQDVDNFLQMAMPFINYDIESLQYEFDVLLSPELKAQMQNIQLKLENIRSAFQNQQAGCKSLKEVPEGAFQNLVPASENVMRSRMIFFSPKHVKKSWRQIHAQSNVKVEAVEDSQEKNSDQSPKLDNSLDILKNHVLNELIQTERAYVRELFTVLLGYRSEMDNPQMFDLMPPLLRNKKDVLFGNMAEIYEFHNNIFMSRLEDCSDAPERVGPCFLERKDDFQMYAKYCQNKPRSELIWRKYSECAFFQECQRKLKHRLGLDSYLLKPVQRITKYQLLLKELLKYSKEGEGTTKLKEALDSMLELLKSVNDSMHQTAINGYVGNINELGKMVLQGSFNVWLGHRKGATKMKDFARFKPMQRHLFLYEKAVMFCKRRFESGEGADRYPSYSFKHCLKMEDVGITEHVKGDNRKFEIRYSEKEEIYIVQAPNVDVKMLWLKEIRKILVQQKELMTAKTQQDQALDQDQLFPQQQNAELCKSSPFCVCEETLFNATEAGAEVEQAGALIKVREAAVLAQAEASSAAWNGMLPSAEGAAAIAEHSYNYFSSNNDHGEDRTQMRHMSEVTF
ncbi:proto-oncogene DBL isoform X5 [Mus musculus]|uniref:proto-oncogene DBL isoform X5 n=1 Tax=Mus musculus TaxID=10090 RepID=UPI0003D78F18|nr:proto-oncogene DBL isoform X5 [Mus musculus]|eukprot:XP_006527806.1 PREDICTED: proto-oncogene DBL isoform X4 [Mus musculus]